MRELVLVGLSSGLLLLELSDLSLLPAETGNEDIDNEDRQYYQEENLECLIVKAIVIG